MIDAKALLDWAKNQSHGRNSGYPDIYIEELEEYINELSTSAPEPQEQAIDIYNTKINGNSIFYNLSEKIGDLKTSYGLRKIERTKEQKVSEMSLYNFINYIFSGKYKKYESVELEPQESIFDSDGWCWDMDLALDRENVLLYVINPDLKTNRATTGMRIDKEFSFAMVSERDNPVAWKLLTIPKEA